MQKVETVRSAPSEGGGGVFGMISRDFIDDFDDIDANEIELMKVSRIGGSSG